MKPLPSIMTLSVSAVRASFLKGIFFMAAVQQAEHQI